MANYSSHQIKYYALDLSRCLSVADEGRFTQVLTDAKVDLNPHQVDAALFAFHSPLSRGAILADEVGLGKTIEAGIILTQLWAEHKRNILIIVPASLRSQWHIELMEKFYLPSIVLESGSYNILKNKHKNPFDTQENIVICSYNFFQSHAKEGGQVLWDLVVIDEAHRLRNAYKKEHIIGNTIKTHLKPFKKLLLTATPLQNNLKELYSLISLIDDNYFTNSENFSDRYNAVSLRDNARYGELRSRLQPIVHRTLRKQVKEYINFTQRSALLYRYKPSDEEQRVYNRLNNYMLRDSSYGIPAKSKALLTLQLRKIMGSSCYALGYTIDKIIHRLEIAKQEGSVSINLSDDLDREFLEEDIDSISVVSNADLLQDEISELKALKSEIRAVGVETKAVKLLHSLDKGFEMLTNLGAQRKALIFTESRRTQEYLKKNLEQHGYANQIVCFNGTNDSVESTAIYNEWLTNEAHRNDMTGNSVIDRKQALVDYFRETGTIMIATEAGAEGINLQFCSLVVNYDMPWNPQRIEQRIGRCHRYGQKCDVVVINFVNQSNKAESRIYELLDAKFQLFDGVFGCSDEVLGAIETEMSFEHKLNYILQTCRTPEEIEAAFNKLQSELESIINDRIRQTKNFLLENFDEEVIQKLRVQHDNNKSMVNTFLTHFWRIINFSLPITNQDETNFSFLLNEDHVFLSAGRYALSKEVAGATHLRTLSDFGQALLHNASELETPNVALTFNLSDYPFKVSILESYKGKTGYCQMSVISSKNLYDEEEFICLISTDAEGNVLPSDFGQKLMELSSEKEQLIVIPQHIEQILNHQQEVLLEEYKGKTSERNNKFVNEEIDKMILWGMEELTPLEEEIKRLNNEVKHLDSALKKETNAQERLKMFRLYQGQKALLNRKRNEYYDKEDFMNQQNNRKFEELSQSFSNVSNIRKVFIIKWNII